MCKWELHFSDTVNNTKSDRLYNIHRPGWNLRRNIMSQIEFFESNGHKFSHISEMNITFITDLRNMTYEHYLNQPKSMLEWKLNASLAKDPKLIKKFKNTYHPLIRKYNHLFVIGENQDLIYVISSNLI